MFPRHFFFFAICALALLAVVTARADEEEGDHVEERNPLVATALRIIAKQFPNSSATCIREATFNCKNDWKKPNELVKCAGRFFEDNKGRCARG